MRRCCSHCKSIMRCMCADNSADGMRAWCIRMGGDDDEDGTATAPPPHNPSDEKIPRCVVLGVLDPPPPLGVDETGVDIETNRIELRRDENGWLWRLRWFSRCFLVLYYLSVVCLKKGCLVLFPTRRKGSKHQPRQPPSNLLLFTKRRSGVAGWLWIFR